MTLRTAVAHLLEQPTKNELEQLYKFRPVYRKLVAQLSAAYHATISTQAAFDIGNHVILRDDPNGEMFVVERVNGDSVMVRDFNGAIIGSYEDTLLQSAYEPLA